MNQAENDLSQAREIFLASSDAANVWQNILPTIEHVLKTYRKDASATERNKLLRLAISKVIYEKKLAKNAPMLYVYPRVSSSND